MPNTRDFWLHIACGLELIVVGLAAACLQHTCNARRDRMATMPLTCLWAKRIGINMLSGTVLGVKARRTVVAVEGSLGLGFLRWVFFAGRWTIDQTAAFAMFVKR